MCAMLKDIYGAATVNEAEQALQVFIYTTNAIDGVNRAVRKIIKTSLMFHTEDAARKLIWLAIENFTQASKRPSPKWSRAIPFLVARYGERFTQASL